MTRCGERWRTALACVVALCAPAAPVAALDPGKRITQYVHGAWSVEDGLPSSSITAMVQGEDDSLWIGTNNGLVRFDGLRFTVYNRRSAPALPSASIAALVQVPGGELFVATLGGGVVRHREGRFESLGDAPELAEARIVTMIRAPDGDLWAGGYGGLLRFRDGRLVRRYGAADGLLGDPVMAIDAGDAGGLLVATATNLHRLRGDRLEPLGPNRGSLGVTLRDLFRLRDGTLLVRSLEGALLRHDGDAFEPWVPAGVPRDVAVRWLLEDRDANLWVGTEQHGLFRVAARGTAHYGPHNGFPAGRVRTLLEDRDGNLWLGSFDRGLHRFRDGAFVTWGRPEGWSSSTVYTVFEDSGRTLWVGTGSGLMRMRGDAITRFSRADGLAGDSVRALHESRARDALWVGSMAGLDRLEDGRVTDTLTTAEGLPLNRVLAVLEDRHGALWIGTGGGGLARRHDGAIRAYTQSGGLADDFVFALLESRDGTLFVGTGDGVSLVRDQRIVAPSEAPDVPGHVTAFHEDDRGVVWIGTEGRGLYRWAEGALVSYERVAGFPDATIYCIVEDEQQRLWFSSYRGIHSIARAELDAAAAAPRRGVDATIYGPGDGLRSVEGNGGQQPSAWRGHDGRLWFATMDGLSVVDPSMPVEQPAPPEVRIEAVIADDRELRPAAPIRLPAGTRRLEIRYGAPSLSTPERTRYRVRLDGFDTGWNDAGARRVASFTNLGRGDYRFRVVAGYGAARSGGREAALDFSIAPHLHQTAWFRLLAALVAATLLFVLYRVRLTWLRAQNAVLRERQRIASEIHDNLAQSFSGIFYQIEAARRRLQRDPEAGERHLCAASELASGGVEKARTSVRDLDASDGPPLVDAIAGSVRPLTLGRVRRFDVAATGTPWTPAPDVVHHLSRIVQEAVSNAIEHGGAAGIGVAVHYEVAALVLRIEDDGCGFVSEAKASAPGRGFGLVSMRRRVARIGGRLEVRSTPGAGTVVVVTVPRGRWLRTALRALSGAGLR